ncbi:MAG: threonine ammonia-lyase [Saprospiraceae bacterium]|nr:threonine ammonia-lyase [Saprospiraceae bacterium]
MSSYSELKILEAALNLKKVVSKTPLQLNFNLSKKYGCNVFLKREDLQIVRSYKLRGAYNMISQLSNDKLKNGVVCASAGNHAQGFAWSCKKLGIKGVVFMPIVTPKQKVRQTKMFGEDWIKIILTGDSFDDCQQAAKSYTTEHDMTFIPPFDDFRIIEGQATVAVEIMDDRSEVDYIFVPIGGGGLAAGIGAFYKTFSPTTSIIGVEPEGAPSMKKALELGKPIYLDKINSFVDGAAVKKVGDITFEICKEVIDDVVLIPEGKVCTTILQLYNQDAIVLEPAGALSISALDSYQELIKGKNVVCVISGSNNDIDRIPEIKERSLQYEGLKHYFLINFVQRPGALKEFLNNILGDNDDITRFEYMQKTNKEFGPALVGIEVPSKEDYNILISKMNEQQLDYTEINKNDTLYGYLI